MGESVIPGQATLLRDRYYADETTPRSNDFSRYYVGGNNLLTQSARLSSELWLIIRN